MKTNTLLALLAGGFVVYLIMNKKSGGKTNEPEIPKCKPNEE